MEIIERPKESPPSPMHAYLVNVTAIYDDGSAAKIDMKSAVRIGDASYSGWPPFEVRDGKTVIFATDRDMARI